jgi:hypothetical protein
MSIEPKDGRAFVEFGLLAKLGSVIVHVEECLSPTGHAFDLAAINSLIEDPEVQEFLKEMRLLALLPEKR